MIVNRIAPGGNSLGRFAFGERSFMRGRPVQIVKTSDWSVPYEVRNAQDDGVPLASFATQGAALAYCRTVGAKVTEVIHAGQPQRRAIT